MKVLIIIDWYYPAYRAGGPITSIFNFVNALSKDFVFFILTSNKDYGNVELSVPVNKWVQVADNHHVFYASDFKSFFSELKKSFFDVIIINGIYSWHYSIFPTLFFRKKQKLVFPRGMLSEHSLKVKALRKKIFVFLAQILDLYKNSCFVVASENERKDLTKIFPNKDVFVLSNFVRFPKDLKLIDKEAGILRLVSVGRVSPVKNYEFAIEALKNVSAKKIIWDIYGTIENKNYFSLLQKKLSELPDYISVNFKGSVSPLDLSDAIAKYHFFYLPSLGENFGHAIYEAFAVGRPVIISDSTPWQDLSAKKIGWDLPLKVDDFKNVLSYAAGLNNEDFKQMCYNAFNFAQKIADEYNNTEKAKKILTLCSKKK